VSESPQGPTTARPTRPAGDYEYEAPPTGPTSAWTGWVTFAGIVLALVGTIHLLSGLVALTEPEKYLVTSQGLVLQLDYTTWGWIHLVFGVAVLLTGVGVLNRRSWARIAGLVVCGLSILANLGFLDATPVWAVTVIALDLMFIYVIVVHGREQD
jgi:hypothetical protein